MESENSQRREREANAAAVTAPPKGNSETAANHEGAAIRGGVGRTPEEAMRNARPLRSERDLEQMLTDTFKRMEGHSGFTVPMPGYEDITLRNVDEVFTYQRWNPMQQEAGTIVREALVAAAKAILRNVPPGGYRDEAIKLLVDTRMKANAAISFNGRF